MLLLARKDYVREELRETRNQALGGQSAYALVYGGAAAGGAALSVCARVRRSVFVEVSETNDTEPESEVTTD